MKVKGLILCGLAGAMMMGAVCSCDKEEKDKPKVENGGGDAAADLEITAANKAAWSNYMLVVARLLKEDAASLNSAWKSGYGAGFKAHTLSEYGSASACVEQIIDGCVDIATEVGEAKIGDPLDLYNSGKTTQALYAVESWYSWHSIDDYSNNILSVRNAYLGSLDGSVGTNSLASIVKASAGVQAMGVDGEGLHKMMMGAIDGAYKAIQSIPAPFRNNINSKEAVAAQEACASLAKALERLKGMIAAADEDKLSAAVAEYVDNVVMPTYENLEAKNDALYNAVVAFSKNPTSEAMEKCAEAWLNARQPWETSEAFLFGPVSEMGLDPNMDSWPLDQAGITNILKSGKYEDLNWDGEYDEDDEKIEAAQGLRGFHTLEYLIFKDGVPRGVK